MFNPDTERQRQQRNANQQVSYCEHLSIECAIWRHSNIEKYNFLIINVSNF